jgi:precorrin-4/cobalt-precorrin-4 C11-methyltransferase
VGTLHETATSEGISKTALLLIGDFLADTPNYEKSKLYDATFTTEYRKGTK